MSTINKQQKLMLELTMNDGADIAASLRMCSHAIAGDVSDDADETARRLTALAGRISVEMQKQHYASAH